MCLGSQAQFCSIFHCTVFLWILELQMHDPIMNASYAYVKSAFLSYSLISHGILSHPHVSIYLGFNSLWRFHKLLWYGHKKLQWITVERLIAPWLLCESGVHVETKGCSVGELIFVHSRDINHVILIAQRLRLMAQHRTVVIKVLYLNGDGSCCSFRRGIWNRNYKQIKLDILKLFCF